MVRRKIDPEVFQGVVSVQHGEGWVKPWRLPFSDLDLFPAPDNSLAMRAEHASGVRLRFGTDSTSLALDFLPLGAPGALPTHFLDVTIEGELVASVPAAEESESVVFEGLPGGRKVLEVWLPQDCGIALRSLALDDGAEFRIVPDDRPKWITYGSSLTHCVRAHSPARTWPGIVARHCGLNLTSLGYGGNCCLEPMVGVMIRDLPADLITLKLGINCIGGALSPRTFPGAVLGLVRIIREKHPETPIGLISPIAYPPNERTPNVLNYTIRAMRSDIRDVHRRLVERGDRNLYYFDGLAVFSEEEIATYTEDQCHPNGDGIELMAEHFLTTVMAGLPKGGE